MKLSRTRCFRRAMKYSINVDQRFENGNFGRKKGEREKNRWTAISFFSLVLFEIELVDADASRLATCREFWCIYRVNIEIFPSRRRRYRAETLIFQRSIEQRREKASIAHPPLAANLSRTRNFSFSFLDRMLHIRPTSYHAFICIYLLFR